jgi:hypothetical protein
MNRALLSLCGGVPRLPGAGIGGLIRPGPRAGQPGSFGQVLEGPRGRGPTALVPGAVPPPALEVASLTEVPLERSEPPWQGYAVRLTADSPPSP